MIKSKNFGELKGSLQDSKRLEIPEDLKRYGIIMIGPKNKDTLKKYVKTVKDLTTIDTSLITSMADIFNSAETFNQPLNNQDLRMIELIKLTKTYPL